MGERLRRLRVAPSPRLRRGTSAAAWGFALVACGGGGVTPDPGAGPAASEGTAASEETAASVSSGTDSRRVPKTHSDDSTASSAPTSLLSSPSSGGPTSESSSLTSSEVTLGSAGADADVDAGQSSALLSLATSGSFSSVVLDAGSSLETQLEAGAATQGDAGVEPWTGPPIVADSGFIDIEAVNYVRQGAAKTSSTARLFYSFHPAMQDPHVAPTFVFFNGGPGYATTLGLMARGTAPMTVGSAEDETALIPNPWSWTQYGNLLYIDTRQTGFSYSTLAEPADADATARQAESYENNFNDYLDSADIVRVMLRVLARTPGVRDNPIVIVGESFGGVRAALTLEFLFDYQNLRSNTWYVDTTLADEVEAHFAAIGDRVNGPQEQIRAQILVQPFVAHTQFDDQAEVLCAPGSRELEIADAAGIGCLQLANYFDPYNISHPEGWSDGLDEVAGSHLMNVSSLASMLEVDPLQIAGLAAADRHGAFRFQTGGLTASQPDFDSALGVLQPWDAYHVTLNWATYNTDVYSNPYPCVFFSMAMARVDTFITDGAFDIVVDTPVLPTTLMKCQGLLAEPFVDSIVASHEPVADEARPGQWAITYNDNSVNGAAQRVVRWPSYEAGHMVAADQPQQLFEDVGAFLRERAVIR